LRSGEPVIQVNVFDDIFNVDEVRKKIIHSYYVHKIIEHELVHYIDNFRNHSMLDPEKEHLRKDSQGNVKAGYWNSPEEFNAYTTNIASPLLSFLRAAKSGDIDKNGLVRFADGLKISKDFNKTLDGILSKLPYEMKEFVKKLRGARRKSMLKRLYILHQEALKYLV
jgi:hypothetical protein